MYNFFILIYKYTYTIYKSYIYIYITFLENLFLNSLLSSNTIIVQKLEKFVEVGYFAIACSRRERNGEREEMEGGMRHNRERDASISLRRSRVARTRLTLPYLTLPRRL